MTLLHVPQEQYTLHSNSNRSIGTIHGSLALIGLLPCFTPWHFSVFITNWFIVAYKHVIGLKTDVSQSNLGGNTDSNHLIPGVVGHFPSVSLRRRPIQLVILIPFFFSPALNAGVLRFVRGSLAPRCFFVLFPAVFRAVPFFFSPASDAGVLYPQWRGKVFPFTVQSRDHLATITDIYVPSFPYVHSPAFNAGFLRRSFRRLMSSGFLGLTSWPADQFLIIISHTRVGVYSFRKQLVIWSSGLFFFISVGIDLI